MVDLNSLIDAPGWTLTSARAINSMGQIVGHGTNDAGVEHAFLLTPTISAVPEPSTWAMMLTGFFGAGALVRRRRGVALV
jgi:probable HAF family extracellular repeat protein